MFFTLKISPLDPSIPTVAPSLNSPHNHKWYSALGTLALSTYDFTVQANFYVWLSNKKEIYLRTHPTLVCNQMILSFPKAFIGYYKIKSWQKIQMIYHPYSPPWGHTLCLPSKPFSTLSKPFSTLPTCPFRYPPWIFFSSRSIS